jgi:hypothetical protein
MKYLMQYSQVKHTVHSILKQVTYIQKLDAMTGVNSNGIANLSSIVEDVIHSHDNFNQVTRDVLCLNVTIHKVSYPR